MQTHIDVSRTGWRAMILAAGFGTRLRPHTTHTPKALFPIDGQPIIDRTIRRLIAAGCRGILINTHHLHRQINAFIAARPYPVPVEIRYEPEILGTGGGIKNAADFFGDRQPFMVLNSDIVTDISLADVYAFHGSHPGRVTLVLYDQPQINTVQVDADDRVLGFDGPPPDTAPDNRRGYTFTGIQVLDPDVLTLIPGGRFSTSIDAYRQVLAGGDTIYGYIAQRCQWRDIGTPAAYQTEVRDRLIRRSLGTTATNSGYSIRPLAGDGSDRHWYRITGGQRTLILVDHGIRRGAPPQEIDAFIDIGRHLHRCGVAVPQFLAWERFAGLAVLADLGDRHLQALARETAGQNRILDIYQRVIDAWIRLAIDGAAGFDPAWTHQSRRYDRDLVIEKEGTYFVTAFLNGYLDMDMAIDTCQTEFAHLADQIMGHAVDGLIHRDCQSRNIMVKDDRFYFIDFQGARPGPIQYDLASLLIDPYVNLPPDIQSILVAYALSRLEQKISIDRRRFRTGYPYCALSRNLQMLGAFGFLTRVKHKTRFEAYIPAAIRSLRRILALFAPDEFPALQSITDCIKINNINFN